MKNVDAVNGLNRDSSIYANGDSGENVNFNGENLNLNEEHVNTERVDVTIIEENGVEAHVDNDDNEEDLSFLSNANKELEDIMVDFEKYKESKDKKCRPQGYS